MEGSEDTPLMLQRRITTVPSHPKNEPSVRLHLAKQKPVVLIDGDGNDYIKVLFGRFAGLTRECAGAISSTTLRKQSLVSELQLRHRDIRALEPGVSLPYPAAIFVRKHALVLNLEGLKLIISKDKTLVISLPQPTDLASRIAPDVDHSTVLSLASHIAMRTWPFGEANGGSALLNFEEMKLMQELPHELRALEAALLVMLKVLASEVKNLEDRLNPVLVRLRARVSRPDLEAVYDIQNKLDKTVARVGKIKEILEEILDDEDELSSMCLTRASRLEYLTPSSPAAPSAAEFYEAVARADSSASGAALESDDSDVSELEDMIEAYWLQVDSLLSRLTILQERITNTEHLVNLDLDAKRNALVSLGLFIDLLLMGFEIHMAVTGTLGQNLVSGLERWEPYSVWAVAFVGAILATGLTLLVALYARKKGLLFLPSLRVQQGATLA